jgi:hypothetical protein
LERSDLVKLLKVRVMKNRLVNILFSFSRTLMKWGCKMLGVEFEIHHLPIDGYRFLIIPSWSIGKSGEKERRF